ncbi:polymorphic toxin-type HINT domain-containing protein [Streptomyces sp. NBC_00846]|uniref:polymorphic toxin-type HINT domain-containing protein n=1 Tax=Streptomyces sp. NBC_00846 TaxID=2975849 RepID=UPI00386E50AE|nr:polymorphic toxin-type HINT domain-containing protein [Streptomyces sp. NBC_00846]
MAVALSVGMLPQYAPQAAARDGVTRPGTQTNLDDPVSGKNGTVRKYTGTDQAARAEVTKTAVVHWPEAASDEVTVGAKGSKGVQADGLPLKVAATGTTSPEAVRLAVLDRKKAAAAGVDGPLMTVSRADDATKSGPVQVSVDYGDFAEAYGGSYGSRLRLVTYPECVLTTPEHPQCTVATPLPTTNDTNRATLTAKVQAAPAATTAAADSKAGAVTSSPVTVLAATAESGGDQGDFGATSLNPSSQWSVSNSSGAFNWSYPISAPPVPGGLAPGVSLTYSSQSVDGQTAATNNQGSWVGEGFSYEPGFIERRYKPCANDGHDNTNGDQCWGYDNATISLAGGTSGELIKDDTTGEWHVRSDDFSKVEKLTGTTNGDDNGEHWKVTSTDGTQYFFGLNQLPGFASGNETTQSAWTVPVYGDDSGEPCYKSTFADAYCNQAWRWNLDYVVDPHGNTMSYFYGTETNYYTQGLKTGENGKPYIRGGYLKRIDYGQRENKTYSTKAAARVVFTTAERCVGDLTDCSAAALKDTTAADWPDVPWDRNCKVDTKCPGQNSPTFWTRKKLTQITTQIRNGDTTYEDVERWKLGQKFTDNGDGSKSLWLETIDHTGLVGTDKSVPSVRLHGIQLANRIDIPNDNIQSFHRFRLSGVESESGSVLTANYSEPECTSATLPTPGKATVRCYPVKWNPPGAKDPVTDWFNKYVVTSVADKDLVGGGLDQVTTYTYLKDAGWRKAKPDGLSKAEYLTWSDWRGYGKVRVETSDGSVKPSNTKTEHVFFRGLDGDTDPDGGTRSVKVTASNGAVYDDSDWKSGTELETTTYNGDKIVSKSVDIPWTQVTGTRVKDWGTSTARFVRPGRSDVYEALAAGGWRQTASTTSYDDKGRAVQVADYGEVDVADNQCTRTEYADNPDKHLYSYASRVETVAVDCGTTPDRSKQVISDDLTFYDSTTTLGAAPTKGEPTLVKRLASHDGKTATYQEVSTAAFDDYGRPLVVTDAAKTPTTVAYKENAYGQAVSKTETNVFGWASTTEYAPEWGAVSALTDMNDKRTDLAYDGLGRLVSVWMPNRSKASFTPSITYEYGIRTTGPNYLRTQKIRKDGVSYSNEYTLYDGLLRPRQMQVDGQGGGRLVADTYYDGSGRVVKINDTYYTTGAPGNALFVPRNEDIDAQTVTEFDGAGRTSATILNVAGVEKNRTTYTYGGDRVHVDPPNGQTPTTTITDAEDRTVELRQYKGDKPLPTGTRADYVATRYGYTPAGQLAKVTDDKDNVWSYTYDQRGRKHVSTDPDTGTSRYEYDDLDRLLSTTDSRSNTITSVYDKIGRVTETWQGGATSGTKLSVSKYDTVAKGELYGTYTYKDGAVLSSVTYTALSDDLEPTRTKYYLSKTAEPELGGTYQIDTAYNADGTVSGQTLPAAGGLTAEAVSYQYDSLQRPVALDTSLGGMSYVSDVSYSPTNKLEQLELTTGGAADKKAWLTYAYEQGTSRLINSRVSVKGAASVLYDARYTYDAGGNVQSIVDTPGGGSTDVQCFRYDGLRRMTEAWTSNVTPNEAVGTGRTDAACASDPSATTVGGTAPYWSSYEFDTLGNRKSETSHGVNGSATSTTAYTYGEKGEGPHQLTTGVMDTTATSTTPAVKLTNTYTYDETGNTDHRVLNGETQTLEWDKQGELSKVTNADGTATEYVYDAAGNRLLSKTASETTFYMPGTELHLKKSTGAVTGARYYSLAGETIAVRDNNGVTFLASDHHGTAQFAVNAATGATQRRRMDPFGAEREGASSNWVDDKGFVGGTVQKSTGLTTLGAREYDATTGRFISADPIIDFTDPQQINGYAYSNGNPVTFSDATGLMLFEGDNTGGVDSGGGTNKPVKNRDKARAGGGSNQRDLDIQAAKSKASDGKRRVINTAKVLTKIAADELGITDAFDCFTTGNLSACGATAVNIISSAVGGILGKIVKKYGLPWQWKKGAALAARLVKLSKKLISGIRDWYSNSKLARALSKCETASNSFTPGTRVLMADGTTKPIEEVRIGDEVLATDPDTGETKPRKVTAEIKGHGLKHLVKVTIDIDGTKGDKTASVTATDGHPFWVPELGAWVDATDLKPGEQLRTNSGAQAEIEAVKRWTAPGETVYNLTVNDLHTYYVLAGATPVLVHNCNFAPGKADEHFDKHVLGLDDAGQATRTPDMPEYDIKDIDKGFDNYVADAKSLMCSDTCPAGAREAIRSDGVIIRMDSQGKVGMRNGNTITTYFRPDDPATYFAREAAR